MHSACIRCIGRCEMCTDKIRNNGAQNWKKNSRKDNTKRLLLYEQLKQSRQGTFSIAWLFFAHRLRTRNVYVRFLFGRLSWPCMKRASAYRVISSKCISQRHRNNCTDTVARARTQWMHSHNERERDRERDRKWMYCTHACGERSVVWQCRRLLANDDVRQFTCSSQRTVRSIPWCIRRRLPLYAAHENDGRCDAHSFRLMLESVAEKNKFYHRDTHSHSQVVPMHQ